MRDAGAGAAMQDPTLPPTDLAEAYRAALDAYLAHAARGTDRDVLLWPDGTYTVEMRLRHLVARDMLHVALDADECATPEVGRRALVRQLATLYLR